MKGWNRNMMRVLWLLFVFIFVLTFILYLQPLERIPSEAFSYVWSAVVLIKLIDFSYLYFLKSKVKLFEIIDPLLVGLLIGALIVSIKWTPIDAVLIRNLFISLSPLFLFIKKGDIL